MTARSTSGAGASTPPPSSGGLHTLRLGWAGLRRDLRAADVRALFMALVLAVAATTMIGFFLDRIGSALERQSGQLLGGDLVLVQGNPFDTQVLDTLEDAGMTTSRQVNTVSMAGFGDRFQLASLKGVAPAYPLYGSFQVDFGDGPETTTMLPERHTVWVEPRLGTALGLSLGDDITLGDEPFRVSGWILEEPDQDVGLASFNPRIMIDLADLERSGLMAPGARLTWRLLAAGPPEAVRSLDDQLEAWQDRGIRVIDVRKDSPRIGRALERSQQYLSLSGLAAVLLAGVAVAMATRRYVDRHLDTAALMRCFGASQQQLARIFAAQLAMLALTAAAAGAVMGLIGQWALLKLLVQFLPLELPPPGPLPLLLGMLTAVAILIGFAGPTLLRLRQVSALKVLRRELAPLPASGWIIIACASLMFGGLLWLYSGDLILSSGLLVGGLITLVVLWGVAQVMLSVLLEGAGLLPQHWRMGSRQLARRRQSSIGQILAFAVTFALMALIALVRTDLIDDWQSKLPQDAPNQFAINIQPSQREGFVSALDEMTDSRSEVYPIVRGRLVEINGVTARDAVPEKARNDGNLRREINLTWAATMPANNTLTQGRWFSNDGFSGDSETAPATRDAPVGVSVAESMAKDFSLALGDRLTFDIGGREVTARITSLRQVDWESFQPNFFVIFPPGPLERFSHSFITAFHLPASEQQALGPLIQQYPSVSLLDIDAILQQVRDLLSQVSRAVELVLLFVLLAGIAVLYAALTASLPARAHEWALLRVFGAGDKRLVSTQLAEFGWLGFASGLLGAMLAEGISALLYGVWLDLDVRLHLSLWLLMPLSGALLIGGIGYLLSTPLRRQAPMESLRLLGEG
ncbi:ABC transporter permease [Kushneria marisflavi]|uniref:ABC transporter permease n=1 Tax=Kushneria marisflavi TaxID=157779 RepID=A0A240UR03_9GAMM|nr:FtsX-like permease family protein [Kushneria marisflavi]ART63937.1 ABC transporter permease [Kushneria marisflavi]RKD85658.1 putative ABC transport system permease protein [Kushneria marisflavi]